MEKHISKVMGKLRANAAHAGRKTVKTNDLQLL
jgi:histone H3/H4